MHTLPSKVLVLKVFQYFPGGAAVISQPVKAGDTDLIPGSGSSPGVGNDKPLQYSCLKNSMNRGV